MKYSAASVWDEEESARGERIYLAGPMTGLADWNYPAFHLAARFIRHAGIPVHNPAEQHGGRTDLPRETYLHDALINMLKCAAVVVLPGWETSAGARLEISAASAAGIPVYPYQAFGAFLVGADEPAEIDITSATKDAESPRASVLNEARDLITGDRNNTYGPPTQDFARTAGILTALGFGHEGSPIEPHHVAMIIASVKLSRLTWSPEKRDNWTDLAGYAGCGYECAMEEK